MAVYLNYHKDTNTTLSTIRKISSIRLMVHIHRTLNHNGKKLNVGQRNNLTIRAPYATYLPEYMWRKRFGEHENVFYNFWSQVAELYPCE